MDEKITDIFLYEYNILKEALTEISNCPPFYEDALDMITIAKEALDKIKRRRQLATT